MFQVSLLLSIIVKFRVMYWPRLLTRILSFIFSIFHKYHPMLDKASNGLPADLDCHLRIHIVFLGSALTRRLPGELNTYYICTYMTYYPYIWLAQINKWEKTTPSPLFPHKVIIENVFTQDSGLLNCPFILTIISCEECAFSDEKSTNLGS